MEKFLADVSVQVIGGLLVVSIAGAVGGLYVWVRKRVVITQKEYKRLLDNAAKYEMNRSLIEWAEKEMDKGVKDIKAQLARVEEKKEKPLDEMRLSEARGNPYSASYIIPSKKR